MKASIRNDNPTAKVRNVDVPKIRATDTFGAILTNAADTLIKAGTPIGLLLTLTYANELTISSSATFKGFFPTARIRNTD